MKPGGSAPGVASADGVPGPQGLMGAALASGPGLIPDEHDRNPPHGEKIKLGPSKEPYQAPELVDATTNQVRPHSLAEDVAADKPLLDDQQGTPYHTTDKAGVHDLTREMTGGGTGQT